MSQNTTIQQSQQKQYDTKIERGRMEKARSEERDEDKKKFEKMSKLLEQFKDIGKKEDEVLNGPMDILKQVGQFLVALSEEKSGGVQGNLEHNLQKSGIGELFVAEAKAPAETADIDAVNRLAERILASLPTSKAPEVQIKVSDSILPDTKITIKKVDGVLAVQIHSDNADAISILSNQGAALQQMLEAKTGSAVHIQVNTEMIARKDNNDEGQSKKDQQQQEEHNENS